MTDNQIEQAIQAKGLTAPRVTPADIDANIVHTEIVKHISPSGQVLRWAVLTTRNGYAVTGRPSASASSANDNAEIGEKVAIENARQELWPLMGYALKENQAMTEKTYLPHQQRVIEEKRELDEKLQKLTLFISSEKFCEIVRSEEERGRLVCQEEAMKYYSEILGARIAAFE